MTWINGRLARPVILGQVSHAKPEYPAHEEVLHALTHGLGAALGVAALVVMIVAAAVEGTATRVVAVTVFGATLVLTYVASTLYHGVSHRRRAKRVLQVLDHCCIYLLIAGTYTPFTLLNLEGAWGWSLFGVVWGLAVLGIAMKATPLGRREKISLGFYLAMGWTVLVAIVPLVRTTELAGLALLVGGGVAYTVGAGFYAWRSLRYHHVVWHLFVLTGSALHVLAVLFYAHPPELP